MRWRLPGHLSGPYCTVTSKFAKGQNGITLFVLLTALSLWVKYALSDQPEMVFSASGGSEAVNVRYCAWVWLCRVEYWHFAR
jgi:hypothetical protein